MKWVLIALFSGVLLFGVYSTNYTVPKNEIGTIIPLDPPPGGWWGYPEYPTLPN